MRTTALVLAFVAGAAALVAAEDYATAQGLQKLISENKVPYKLVDVRTAEEFASGHIPTAVNIPYDVILDKPPTEDKSALIVVYCRSGSRSAMAYRSLKGAGYTNVVNFGGIGKWQGEIVKP
jgi:phage shock protein E